MQFSSFGGDEGLGVSRDECGEEDIVIVGEKKSML